MSDGAADSAADARAQLDTVLASLGVLRSRVGSAKTVPMSASVMVNKKDTLAG
jgi:myo-inositol catabolism protein IolC